MVSAAAWAGTLAGGYGHLQGSWAVHGALQGGGGDDPGDEADDQADDSGDDGGNDGSDGSGESGDGGGDDGSDSGSGDSGDSGGDDPGGDAGSGDSGGDGSDGGGDSGSGDSGDGGGDESGGDGGNDGPGDSGDDNSNDGGNSGSGDSGDDGGDGSDGVAGTASVDTGDGQDGGDEYTDTASDSENPDDSGNASSGPDDDSGPNGDQGASGSGHHGGDHGASQDQDAGSKGNQSVQAEHDSRSGKDRGGKSKRRDESRDREARDGASRGSTGDRSDGREYREMYDNEGYPASDDEVLVLADAGALSEEDFEGLRVIQRDRLDGLDMTLVRIRVDADADVAEVALDLAERLDGDDVDFNHVYRAESGGLATAAAMVPAQYNALIGLNPRQPNIVELGMIDTAIDVAHPALRGVIIEQRDFVSRRGSRPKAHGTAIASILAGHDGAKFSGLLPDASLHAAGIFFRDSRDRLAATAEGLIRALDWLVAARVRVVNMSLTGPPNRLLETAIERAFERGTIVVAAVGNAGPAAPPLYPAAYAEVIAVTAVGPDQEVYRRANRGPHLDFAAPGVAVQTAQSGGGYRARSGTSIAAPFATATLAAAMNGLSDDQALGLLKPFEKAARDLGRAGFDPIYGHGLIQAIALPKPRDE